MSLPSLSRLIEELALEPHPEGGFFRRTYVAPVTVPHTALPQGFGGERAVASAIFYLLERGGVSRLHRLRSDEMWHHYLGGPLTVVELPAQPLGAVRETTLGPDLLAGQRVQHTVAAGTLFGAAMPAEAAEPYALVGCTVHPGFDFAEFELAERGALLETYAANSQVRAWIERLT